MVTGATPALPTAVAVREGKNEEDDKEETQACAARVAVRVLRYTARPPEFPAPEEVRVCFVSGDTLLDLANNDTMAWRRAGAAVGGFVGSVDDVVGSVMDVAWRRATAGRAVDAATQLRVASVMRVASERFRGALSEAIAARRQPAALVDAADVQAAFQRVAPFLAELRETLAAGN